MHLKDFRSFERDLKYGPNLSLCQAFALSRDHCVENTGVKALKYIISSISFARIRKLPCTGSGNHFALLPSPVISHFELFCEKGSFGGRHCRGYLE